MLRGLRRSGPTLRRNVERHGKNFLIPENFVILSEAKDLLFAAKNRSFASLRMTIMKGVARVLLHDFHIGFLVEP